ncbi:NADH:quinone oxidoreductase [Pseudomonas sp. R5(2019)]|nr:NADH:quinone oxidoreductase [Pseudomonas sp. R5(2019)]
MLGASQTLVQACAMLLASLLVVVAWRLCIAPLRRVLHSSMQDVACLLLAAGIVTCLELTLRAWTLALYHGLGPYPALLVLNCLLLERTAQSPLDVRALARYGALLVTLGLARELIANGTLSLSVHAIGEHAGLRLAVLAPGALILSGLLLAGARAWSLRALPTDAAKETPEK